ncbi:MAG TPA: DUF169 domain-containing protein [Dehalococcoidia bacterium]
MSSAARVQQILGLRTPPIAVGYLDAPPAGLPRWDGGPVPSGCTFWREAQAGRAFYTVPADHLGCAIGAYTHHVEVPPDRAGELEGTLSFMVDVGYLRRSEVPEIPRLPAQPGVVAYAPADNAPFAPAAVLVAARPAQAMLLFEAAVRAGVAPATPSLAGRPTCAILPVAAGGGVALSLGCMGNRLYTELPEDELYLSLPGDRWDQVAAALEGIRAANDRVAAFHRERLSAAGAGPAAREGQP